MWPNEFHKVLLSWNKLREETKTLPVEKALHKINNWWAQCPTVEYYLHLADYEEWPDPWELLANNTFCDLAKCLGIIYTLHLIKHTDIRNFDIVEIDECHVVSVNNEEFFLNYDLTTINVPTSVSIKNRISGDFFKNCIV